MKKLLSTLFISLCGLVSFSYGVSNCLEPYDNISSQYDDSYSNCDYQDSLIVCVYGQMGNVEFPSYGPTYNLQSAPLCTLLSLGDYITVHSRNSEYQILVFPSVEEPPAPPDCPESVCNITVYDSFNMQSSNVQYGVEPGNIQYITFSYNSSNSSYSVGGSNSNPIYTFSPSNTLLNCSSNLSTCQSNLSSCQSSLSNTMCESHVSFSDISNGTGVKFLNSYFSPFSGANNVSVYYDSQDNVIQVDNQYGVAEVISAVPSTPPTPCDCSESISGAVASCNSQLSSLSGNYNSCLSELNSCMAGGYNTGDLTWSALYINQIQHLGKPIIRINIPEEISRDYVNTGDSFDLDINGYNVDTEYVDNIIKIQNYQPTTEDFTKLVGLFGKYGGLLVSCLLVIIIFALVRKMFK